MEVTGSVFVVTGGGNGIGREVVLGLLARGAKVAAVDLSAEGLAETTSLAGVGDRLSAHTVDITDREAVDALPAAVHAPTARSTGCSTSPASSSRSSASRTSSPARSRRSWP